MKQDLFKITENDGVMEYEEVGEVKLIHLILAASMLKELILEEIEPKDENANVNDLYNKMIEEVDKIDFSKKEELFN